MFQLFIDNEQAKLATYGKWKYKINYFIISTKSHFFREC